MASFNIEEGADTDPSWYGTFYKPGDQDWWDKGAHKALGQSFLRALVRQVAPELGTAEAGDLGNHGRVVLFRQPAGPEWAEKDKLK